MCVCEYAGTGRGWVGMETIQKVGLACRLMHASVYTCTHTHTHPYTHIYMHTLSHTLSHAPSHTHTHTHSNTHTGVHYVADVACSCPPPCCTKTPRQHPPPHWPACVGWLVSSCVGWYMCYSWCIWLWQDCYFTGTLQVGVVLFVCVWGGHGVYVLVCVMICVYNKEGVSVCMWTTCMSPTTYNHPTPPHNHFPPKHNNTPPHTTTIPHRTLPTTTATTGTPTVTASSMWAVVNVATKWLRCSWISPSSP